MIVPAPTRRHNQSWITYHEDGSQTHHLADPDLWRHVWSLYRGKRLWAIWWYLTHRTTRP